MKIEDIVFQLHNVLPDQTTLFTEQQGIGSITKSGTTATVTTTGCHTVQTGEYVNIVGAKNAVTITSLTRVGTVATAITSSDHGLTQELPQYQTQVEIQGAVESDYNGIKDAVLPPEVIIESITQVNNVATITTRDDHGFVANTEFFVSITGADQYQYNGKFAVQSTPTSTTFTVNINGNPVSPATGGTIRTQAVFNRFVFFYTVENAPTTPATGTIQLLQPQYFNQGYAGRFAATRIDDTQFTYELDSDNSPSLSSPAQGTIVMHRSPRVTGAVNIERALEAYTAREANELWAIVVLDDEFTSKDRNTVNDSTATIVKGSDQYRLTEIRPFSVYVVTPSTEELLGIDARDLMVDVKRALYKSLLNVKFPTDLTEDTLGAVIPTTNGFFGWANAYYVHRFQFETQSDVVLNDAVDPDYNVAFRCIDMTICNDLRPIITQDSFNLDTTS